jgi:3-methyl-2-oxobutanoate hydroxymethyltransferase
MTSIRSIRAHTTEDAPITMLTAYDAQTAAIIDEVGVDVILVGDSLGNTALGYDSTLPVTLAESLSHTAAVTRGVTEAVVVADMPFLSFGIDTAESIRNAGRFIKEAGADAVKLESGPHTVGLTERLVSLGIPVQAHLGVTPQHLHTEGLAPAATTAEAREVLLEQAVAQAEAGAFSLILEYVPAEVAAAVTEAVEIPTIGIGSGPHCDGQVLVTDDVLGLTADPAPFAAAFGDVRGEIQRAVMAYREAVREGTYPTAAHSPDSVD